MCKRHRSGDIGSLSDGGFLLSAKNTLWSVLYAARIDLVREALSILDQLLTTLGSTRT